jgi:hypothetical protein
MSSVQVSYKKFTPNRGSLENVALVAFRIWFINRQTIVFTGYSMRPIIFLVIESGAVYSLTLLVLLVLYKVQSWFQYVVLDAVRPTSFSC